VKHCGRRKVQRVGTVQLKEKGRPEWLYSKRNMKLDMGYHEYWLTEWLFPFVERFEITRTFRTDDELRPDATLIGKSITHVEMDCHTESLSFVRERMELHKAKNPNRVVWVCFSEERKAGLMEAANGLDRAFFTTLGSDEWTALDGTVICVSDLLNK